MKLFRFESRGWGVLALFLMLALGVLACTASDFETTAVAPAPESMADILGVNLADGVAASVVRIIDGDTIDVDIDGEQYRVRYIGINTPERDQYWYSEATAANRDWVAGQTVILIKDVSETDRYGRLLRYIFLTDGTFVNAELVAAGQAEMVSYPPDIAYRDLFDGLEQEARDQGLGMWR